MQAAFAPVSHSRSICSLGSTRYTRSSACKPHAQATRQVNELISCDQASLCNAQWPRYVLMCSKDRSQEDQASNPAAVLLRHVIVPSSLAAKLPAQQCRTFNKHLPLCRALKLYSRQMLNKQCQHIQHSQNLTMLQLQLHLKRSHSGCSLQPQSVRLVSCCKS